MNTLRSALALAGALLAAGCANFEAVNQTAGELVSASDAWSVLAKDFKGSCERRNLLVATARDVSDCAQERRATDSLAATDKVLAAYFLALQQASTTSNFSVDPGLASVATVAEGLPGVQSGQVDAVTGLASYLAGLVTRGVEERTVKRLVADGAPRAEAVLDVLIAAVVPELENQYRGERRQTLAAFTSYAQQSGTVLSVSDDACAAPAVRDFPTGVGYLLGQAYCTRIVSLQTKQAALASYKDSLMSARQTLVELQHGADDLTAKELAKQLGHDASGLKNDIQALKQTF